MGFNSVYRVLQEVFPQVDARVLRAVAIEHSKDADAAVEVVLAEVIPFLSERSRAAISYNKSGIVLNPSENVIDANTTAQADDTRLSDSTCLDEEPDGSSFYDANGGHDPVCGDAGHDENDELFSYIFGGYDELISPEKCDESSTKVPDMSSHVTSITLIQENGANDNNEVCGDTENEEIISYGKFQESSIKVGSEQSTHVRSTTLKLGDSSANGSTNSHLHADWEDFDGASSCDFNKAICGESLREQSCVDGNPLEVKNSLVQMASSPVQECTGSAPESSLQLVVVPDMLITDFEKPEPSGSFDAASTKDTNTSEMVDLQDDSALNTIVTRSGQICSIDLLEDIIEDARSNKKTLFSAVESVISLMREVELQEEAAEQAKEEAARGGLDTLTRVEDLKQMLQHAKEANDMHAGEVYGEKAILATEVRELQSRLLSLSDERDKSLAILDEMRQTLEVRLATAEKEWRAAEQEKLEKEESARKALVDQELIMEKVVQESKILKQEAEENSKLREFLMDRGRVVDMLQGEISVICQDVKLLKEKFDERVPLSKSLSSSQTSCILASSSSSLKIIAPDQVPEQANSSETSKKTSPTPSIDDQLSPTEERAGDDRKALVDDGWEFFDNREFYM